MRDPTDPLGHGSKNASLLHPIPNRVLLSKRKLINTLFLLSFPFYGIGMYLGIKASASFGTLFAVAPFILILLVHGLDLVYRRQVRNMVTGAYWVGLLFLLTLVWSFWKAQSEGFPSLQTGNTFAFTIMFLVPFHAAIVVHIRNRDQPDFDFSLLLLKSLSILVFVNILGYAAGLQNVVHRIEGRINLPFLLGIYDAAHLLAIINLMLLFYMKDFARKPYRFMLLFGFYMVNMAIMISVNSRLSFMTFLLLTGLFFFKSIGKARLVFPISLFVMPLLVNFALFIYWVLTLPFMTAIVSRVDKADVTTFNNRTTVWDVGWAWLENDRSGLLLGHGYQGQYKLDGWDHIAEVFNTRNATNVHMHSTFMQTLIGQGIVGYGLFLVVMWQLVRYFRSSYLEGRQEAPLFAMVVYLLFILQIDIVCYGNDFGNALTFCLFAMVVMDPKYISRKPRALDGTIME